MFIKQIHLLFNDSISCTAISIVLQIYNVCIIIYVGEKYNSS